MELFLQAGDTGIKSRLTIGVNAAGVAGVATPQYLTCKGRPVLTTAQYFDKCFIFPSAQLGMDLPVVRHKLVLL